MARLVASGRSVNSIAKSYGVDEATVRRGIAKIKTLADRVVKHAKAEKELNIDLDRVSPIQQNLVLGLAKALMGVSTELGAASLYAARSSHLFHKAGHGLARKVDQRDPFATEESRDAFAQSAHLIKAGNMAAETPLNLLRANAEAVKEINKSEQDAPEPKQIVFTTIDASNDAEP